MERRKQSVKRDLWGWEHTIIGKLSTFVKPGMINDQFSFISFFCNFITPILLPRSKANYSKVLVFGECDSSGGRNYLHTVTSGTKNPGVNHPYGITFDHHGNIYVSFQHTNTVLRFKKDTFEPFPSPPYLPSSSSPDEPYPGTFYQYPSQLEGIRDVVFVNKYLWIANEDQKGISIVNLDGEEVHRIHMRDHAKPIGFHYDENVGLVFVSSRSSYGAVYGINPISREVSFCLLPLSPLTPLPSLLSLLVGGEGVLHEGYEALHRRGVL
jgi:hypothetical protein